MGARLTAYWFLILAGALPYVLTTDSVRMPFVLSVVVPALWFELCLRSSE